MITTTDDLRAFQSSYEPSSEVVDRLKEKVLVAVIGPVGIGKSTIMEEAARQDDEFGRTGSVITRAPRESDDMRLYHHVTHAQMRQAVAQRSLVQYIVHPTTGDVYATDLGQYTHKFNMLDALPGSINDLHRLPFNRVVVIYMVTSPDAWKQWLRLRYPVASSERTKRILEAQQNLQWVLDQPKSTILWLENTAGNQATTAQQLIAIAKSDVSSPKNLRSLAVKMLAVAKTL